MSSIFGHKDFLGKPAPPNYVPGLGRGAIGFTTRSDIGPAREPTLEEMESLKKKAEDQGLFVTEADRFDHVQNEEGLLGTGPYDKEDEEADRIYAQVDTKLEERRKARREQKERELVMATGSEKLNLQEEFAELKRGLSEVTYDDWMNLPEPGDLRAVGRKMKKLREKEKERWTPTPDSLLLAARTQTQWVNQLDAQSGVYSVGKGIEKEKEKGNETSETSMGTGVADLRQINKARDDLLKVKLDQVMVGKESSVNGLKTTVDPKGYLTDLQSLVLKTDAEIGDIRKARELLKSVITTNPKHGPGWIALARVEEIDHQLDRARSVIAQGCEACPSVEDVWLEAARLHPPDQAKRILANGVRRNPLSVKIWLYAMHLERDDVRGRKRIVRKALEFIPNSVQLWKAAVELEEEADDARLLLSRAVECVPLSVELWLALARLETYEQAKKVLNRARSSCPTSFEIYIAACRLEESHGGPVDRLRVLLQRAVMDLSRKGANLSREQWIHEAERCEAAGSVATCQAIVQTTLGLDVQDEDREQTWTEDAEASLQRDKVETARAMYAHALQTFSGRPSLWLQAASLEKERGTPQQLEALLSRAVRYCPQAEVLWLMGAKEKWLAGDVGSARAILQDAFKANPNSEQIWLAAVKLETENGEHVRGRSLLQRARDQASTERVWLKSIVLERNLGQLEACEALLKQALERYPTYAKFWMIRGQLEHALGRVDRAREVYAEALKQCPHSIPLWLLASRLESSQHPPHLIRSRALLDRALHLHPSADRVWLELIRLEIQAGHTVPARSLMSRALQQCPFSGLLWAESIWLEPRPGRKARSVDALKKCDHNGVVVTAVARLFWAERNLDKARAWFQRAVKLDPDWGDAWASFYQFELQFGTDEQRQDVVQRCVAAEPRHGEVWCRIAKHPDHWRLSIEQVLKLAAEEVHV